MSQTDIHYAVMGASKSHSAVWPGGGFDPEESVMEMKQKTVYWSFSDSGTLHAHGSLTYMHTKQMLIK